MSVEAMKQALEALDISASCVDPYYVPLGKSMIPEVENAITALRQAIEQAEKQEVEHYSDCAVHNEPAYPKGECDCKTILPKLIATVPDNMQDWAEIDGTTAWHLMERHADNWADIGKMMDEFVAAKLAKREWVGLTDEEIKEIIRPFCKDDETAEMLIHVSMDEYRAIEAKLKEKNT